MFKKMIFWTRRQIRQRFPDFLATLIFSFVLLITPSLGYFLSQSPDEKLVKLLCQIVIILMFFLLSLALVIEVVYQQISKQVGYRVSYKYYGGPRFEAYVPTTLLNGKTAKRWILISLNSAGDAHVPTSAKQREISNYDSPIIFNNGVEFESVPLSIIERATGARLSD